MKPTSFLAIPLLACPLIAFSQEDPEAAKLTQLRKTAQSCVDFFNKQDASGLAGLFLKNGEMTTATGETITGREQILSFYEGVFDSDEPRKAALEAGSVRFLLPGIAVEDGTFHVTLSSGEVISHDYTAVQIEQEDGSWLTARLKDSIEDSAPASEKMIALDWIIGDWKVEIDGASIWIAFEWSKDGPYIDGRLLSEKSGSENTATTFRIGWNALLKGYTSWAFDELGGYTHSEWTFDGNNGWLLRTRGITADGEANICTQTIQVGISAQSFTWTTRDQIIGGQIIPSRKMTVVKRPPSPKSATAQ